MARGKNKNPLSEVLTQPDTGARNPISPLTGRKRIALLRRVRDLDTEGAGVEWAIITGGLSDVETKQCSRVAAGCKTAGLLEHMSGHRWRLTRDGHKRLAVADVQEM